MGGRAKAALAEARDMTAVSFAEAMGMVKDKEKTEAFFDRLEGLKAEISQEQDKGLTIEEIERLLIQTRDDRNMAREELEAARAKAAEITHEADAVLKDATAQNLAMGTAARESKSKIEHMLAESRKRIGVDEKAAKVALGEAGGELEQARRANAAAKEAEAIMLEKKDRALAALAAIDG